jgi:hypothetical protein
MKTGLTLRSIRIQKRIREIMQLIFAGRDVLQGTDALTAHNICKASSSRNSTYSNLQLGEKQISKQANKNTHKQPSMYKIQ